MADAVRRHRQQLFRRLNAIDFTHEQTPELVEHHVPPFDGPEWRIENNRIIYHSDPWHLVVCRTPAEIDQALRETYDSPDTGSKGQRAFYDLIRSRFLGITRADATDFLRKQTAYQLTRPVVLPRGAPTKKYNRENAAWAIDLIDLGASLRARNAAYILSVLDLYTQKCWLRKCATKDAPTVLLSFQTFANPQFKPRFLYSDNGAEFKGVFSQWLQAQNITHYTTQSYTPVPSIESLNGRVRKALSDHFVRTRQRRWDNALPQIEQSLNAGSQTPMRVLKRQEEAQHPPEQVARIAVGDFVRIALRTTDIDVRRHIKLLGGKNIHIKWSLSVYVVGRRYAPPVIGQLHSYALRYMHDNEWVRNTDGTVTRFKHADLLVVPNPAQHRGETPTEAQMRRINAA